MDYFKEKRKSFIEIGNIYFWTATINSWIKLWEQDALKQIVVNSLHYLHKKKKIEVYAFVVMPNLVTGASISSIDVCGCYLCLFFKLAIKINEPEI